MQSQYPPELIQQAQLKPEDTPESYQERLLQLYPKPEQQAYINAMIAISRVAIFALNAMQSYKNNQPLLPVEANAFPEAQNSELIEKRDQEGYLDIPLPLNPDIENLVIVNANSAAFYVRQTETRIVKAQKDAIRAMLFDESAPNGLSIRN